MIGTTIHIERGFPTGVVVWLMAAAAVIALAVIFANPHLGILAVLPLAQAVVLWWYREQPFLAHLTDDTLEVADPAVSVPYASMQIIRRQGGPGNPHKPGRKRRYLMQVIHEQGAVQIPSQPRAAADALFKFLCSRLSPQRDGAIHADLAQYHRQQVEAYGADRVWAHAARSSLGLYYARWRMRAFFVALLLTGVLWIGAGFLGADFRGWWIAAICLSIFAGLCYLALWSDARSAPNRIRKWHTAGLVIAPDGLAMVQGDLRGKMRWEELKDVRMKTSAWNFEAGVSGLGILLRIEGAELVIADIYDRPLFMLLERIENYWRPGKAEA